MEKDCKYRPFLYPNFDESLDEQYIQDKKKKKDTLDKIENVMAYFGKPD